MKRILYFCILLFGFTASAQNQRSKVVLYDDFYDNNRGWPIEKTGWVAMKISNGYLNIDRKSSQGYDYVARYIGGFSDQEDYTIESSFQHMRGMVNAGFGLVYGRRDKDNQFEFFISGNGHYKIRKISFGQKNDIRSWTKTSYINKGDFVSNTLKIKKEGLEWKFYINGNFVTSHTAERWMGNSVGFMVGLKQKVAVDYISVKKVSSSSDYQQQITAYQPRVNNPPEITIIEPNLDRGFKALNRQFARIVGTVTDTDGIQSLTVNGLSAQVQSTGRFEFEVPLAYGMNTIRIEAVDNRQKSAVKTFSVTRQELMTQNNEERRIALLVGNSDYKGKGDLSNPVNDVRAMANSLRQLGFEVMQYEDCSRKQLLKAIDEFGERLKEKQVGLFFYAGHGIQVDGENYLVPTDASLSNKNDVVYDCVATGRIMGRLEGSDTKTNIVILDACRDNPFERSWSRSTKSSGLAFMNAPSGSFVAYATSPGATAADGSGNNGVYTEALLNTIQTPNLTIEEVFKRVRSRVKERTGGKQIPWESTSLEGAFYFKR